MDNLRKKKIVTAVVLSVFVLGLILFIDFLTADKLNYLGLGSFQLFKLILIPFFVISLALIFTCFENQKVRAVFIGGGIFVGTLLILVVLIQTAFYFNQSEQQNIVFSSKFHHVYKPNISFNQSSYEYDFDIQTNSLGFREQEIQPKKEGTIRVLMLGDSHTLGFGVQENERFTDVFEQSIEGVEVVNLGMLTYSPITENNVLREYFDLVEPDIVVLNFDMGDVVNDYTYEKAIVERGEGYEFRELVKQTNYVEGILRGSTNRGFIVENFRLLFLNEFISNLPSWFIEQPSSKMGKIPEDYVAITREKNYDLEEHWQRTFKYIKLASDYSKEKGAVFVLHVIPYGHQVSVDEWRVGRYQWGLKQNVLYSDKPFKVLQEFAKREGMFYLSSLEALRAAKEGQLFFPYDGHLTVYGNLVVGEFLAEELMEAVNA